MNLEIYNLAEKKQYLDLVTKWLWEEWGKDKSYEYAQYQMRHNVREDRIPMTFIALADGQPVGSVSLWLNDLRCRQDLSPWLASLFVVKEMRNKGVGQKLQERAELETKKLNYPQLYLFTQHEGYYEKSGWDFLELAPKIKEGYTRIYKKKL